MAGNPLAPIRTGNFLGRTDPLMLLHREMNRLFDDVYRDVPAEDPVGSESRRMFGASMNVSETENAYPLTAELWMYTRTILLSVALAGSASAQEVDVQAGRDLFMTYCWQCHGQDASGNGPMAEMLAITTPDLTTLAARNNGMFPLQAVARQIDGRDALLAHGGEMPIFGPFLDMGSMAVFHLPSGQPMMTSLPLANVIVYLESLQEE